MKCNGVATYPGARKKNPRVNRGCSSNIPGFSTQNRYLYGFRCVVFLLLALSFRLAVGSLDTV